MIGCIYYVCTSEEENNFRSECNTVLEYVHAESEGETKKENETEYRFSYRIIVSQDRKKAVQDESREREREIRANNGVRVD